MAYQIKPYQIKPTTLGFTKILSISKDLRHKICYRLSGAGWIRRADGFVSIWLLNMSSMLMP